MMQYFIFEIYFDMNCLFLSALKDCFERYIEAGHEICQRDECRLLCKTGMLEMQVFGKYIFYLSTDQIRAYT